MKGRKNKEEEEEEEFISLNNNNNNNNHSNSNSNNNNNNRAAWEDEDDESITVNIAASDRLKKLRKSTEEDVITGTELSQRLRQQYVVVVVFIYQSIEDIYR